MPEEALLEVTANPPNSGKDGVPCRFCEIDNLALVALLCFAFLSCVF